MAPLVTHLVIGERVSARSQRFDPKDYGAFLLGCVLVDVHGFSNIDRHRTHFAGRLDEDGVDTFDRSCANFLSQLDDLLLRPWSELTGKERAFVVGYLCHLATDEDWKQFSWNILHTLGVQSLADLPVPGEVFMTVFDVLSSELYVDFPAVVSALNDASVPDVLTHIPHDAFQTMWDIIKEHAMDGTTPESYFEMLKRMGRTGAEIQAVRHEHDVYWESAVASVHDLGGVEPRIQAAVRRSLEALPLLWA